MTVSTPDDVLDQRLREAMQRIADDYRAGDDGRRLASVERADGGRRKWARRMATAAAAIVALGVASVWFVADGPDRRPADPPSVSSAVPPRFGDDFEVPEVDPLPWAVQLDPVLDVGSFERPNRYEIWLYSNDAITRHFVLVENGQPAATILVGELPAWTWPRYENGVPYRDVAGVDARLDANINSVAWRRDGVVRTALAMGSASDELADVVATANELDDLADLERPAGFEEVSYRPFAGWQSSPAGWTIGVIEPDPGGADLLVAAMVAEPGAEAIDGGWLRHDVDESADNTARWDAWVRAGDFVVWVRAPGYVDDEVMRDIAGLIEVVPATLPERPLEVWVPGTMIERQDPVAGGELSWGRWLAVTDVEAARGRDVDCLAFTGVVDFHACSESGAEQLTACGPSNTTPSRLVMVTTIALEPESLPVSVEVAGEVIDAVVERSGGLTFVNAETDGPRGPLRFIDATGAELCTG